MSLVFSIFAMSVRRNFEIGKRCGGADRREGADAYCPRVVLLQPLQRPGGVNYSSCRIHSCRTGEAGAWPKFGVGFSIGSGDERGGAGIRFRGGALTGGLTPIWVAAIFRTCPWPIHFCGLRSGWIPVGRRWFPGSATSSVNTSG